MLDKQTCVIWLSCETSFPNEFGLSASRIGFSKVELIARRRKLYRWTGVPARLPSSDHPPRRLGRRAFFSFAEFGWKYKQTLLQKLTTTLCQHFESVFFSLLAFLFTLFVCELNKWAIRIKSCLNAQLKQKDIKLSC